MLINLSAKLTLFVVVASVLMAFSDNPPNEETNPPLMNKWEQLVYSNYSCLQDTSLNIEAFRQGLHGFYKLKSEGKLQNENYLTVVDFSQHSSKKRMYVIDTENFEIVYKSLCAHGKNTGKGEAKSFSNRPGSLQSSYGFFIAQETYTGKFDLAMRLDGLEYCNSKARDRGIVVHGADYATPSFLLKNDNVLGRSFGCPSLPKEDAPSIINTIKEGSCFFIYSPSKTYKKKSHILNDFDFLSEV
ncbi:MAG: murein L,D-transpeptidase catalytic domain family protein [Brumimicrobium sp.]